MATSLRDFFGFMLKDKDSKQLPKSIVQPNTSDGSVVIDSTVNGVVGDSYLLAFDPEGQIKNEIDLIRRYRELSRFPEVSEAIEDIINESIITDDSGKVVSLNLDELKLSEGLKKKIIDSFNEILIKLDFYTNGHEIFKNWYIDGKLLYQIILDEMDIKKGIHELRYIDPRKIKKIKNIKKETVSPGIEIIKDIDEYYLYNDKGISNTQQAGVKLSKDSVVYCHSGIIDPNSGMVQSYLHKAIKPANQLKMLEESVVIYRYTRAPERRVFYIDVGNLPKGKAEQYVNDMMNKFKNKLSYDAVTGDLVDSKRHLSMMEDFWLPRRDNGKSTEITTLPGGCLQMDTAVSLLDGRELSIRDIESELNAGKELWTYSCDEFTGEIKPGLISWAGVTHASAKVIKLTLDNGETITCTPDHKFPVYDRGFVRADELTIDQSMIPLYRKKEQISKHKKLDYEQIFDNASKKWKYTHRMVHQFVELEEFIYKNVGDFSVTHHKNHNRFDNSPDNLVRMSWEDHALYHADAGFAEDAQKLGTIAAAARLAHIKENDPAQYSKFIEASRDRWVEWWTNMSEEEYFVFCKNVSAGINKYFANLQPDQRATRTETNRKNMRKATDAFSLKSKTDVEFRENLNIKLRAAWSDENRNAQQEKTKKINAAAWGDATKSDKRRQTHKELQKFEYDRSILVEIINLVKGKTSHQITLKDVVRLLNENQRLLQLLLSLHENKRIPMWKPECGFTDGYVTSLVKHFKYESWGDFRKKESLYNHKIVNIEWLEDEIEVGTLTIDGYEIIHGHHTFALSAGIFTKNSGMSQLDDLDYFLNKLYHSLNVPVSRMKPETGFSIGRSDTISRDEIKFGKFVEKLRTKFNSLFMDLLRVQLVSKGICTVADWDGLKDKIRIIYAEDNHFSELKENEILNTRLSSLSQIDAYVGKYVSKEWVQKHILKFTEEEISELNKQIKEEGPSPEELAVQQAGDQAGPPQ